MLGGFSHSLVHITTWSKPEETGQEQSNTPPTSQPSPQVQHILFIIAQMLAELNSRTDPYMLKNSTASKVEGQMYHKQVNNAWY